MHKNHRRHDPRHTRKQHKFRNYGCKAGVIKFMQRERNKRRRMEEQRAIAHFDYDRLSSQYPKDIAYEF